jgi:YafQ family addiction module toxin component
MTSSKVMCKMYDLEVKSDADKIFRKLARRNPNQLKILSKKISSIQSQPSHTYKFLRPPLQRFNRVHIDTNFVLIFKIAHVRKTVVIYYFDHHDKVYKWIPRERR